MSRTTPADVKQLTGSTLDNCTVQSFINTSYIIINKSQACANVDDDTLEEAEKYLAAHLMTLTTGGGGAENASVTSESIDSQSISYGISQISGQGILATSYGQTANMLMNGCLAELDKRRSAVIFSGGA